MRKILTVVLMAVTLFGCATAQKMNSISLGMTKEQVVTAMGPPTSTSAKTGAEYMTYAFYETHEAAMHGWSTPYFVKLVDGKVDSYGRKGDFNSTAVPEQTVNLNVKKQEIPAPDKTSANP